MKKDPKRALLKSMKFLYFKDKKAYMGIPYIIIHLEELDKAKDTNALRNLIFKKLKKAAMEGRKFRKIKK